MALKLKRFKGWSSPALVVPFLLATSAAHAATLNVVAGQLIGASNVDVGGTLYNVAFYDGTCIDLFNGCDSPDDFVFTSSAAAALASQALLDQVFLDTSAGSFDTHPEFTRGCADLTRCNVDTPYEPSGLATFSSDRVGNEVFIDDASQRQGLLRSADYGGSDSLTFAAWSPVPEPGTALLMGMGLLVMGVRTRRA